jgi:hypothetical protein
VAGRRILDRTDGVNFFAGRLRHSSSDCLPVPNVGPIRRDEERKESGFHPIRMSGAWKFRWSRKLNFSASDKAVRMPPTRSI